MIRIIHIDSIGVFFKVPSSTDENVVYDVHVFYNYTTYSICELGAINFRENNEWICTCQGWYYRHTCKHIKACETLLGELYG